MKIDKKELDIFSQFFFVVASRDPVEAWQSRKYYEQSGLLQASLSQRQKILEAQPPKKEVELLFKKFLNLAMTKNNFLNFIFLKNVFNFFLCIFIFLKLSTYFLFFLLQKIFLCEIIKLLEQHHHKNFYLKRSDVVSKQKKKNKMAAKKKAKKVVKKAVKKVAKKKVAKKKK